MTKDIEESSEKDQLIPKAEQELEPALSEETQPVMGFMFLGFVGNLTFNFILQEVAFFNRVFGSQFGSTCGFIYGLSNNVGQLLVLFVGSGIPMTVRVVVSCIALAGTLTFFPLMSYLEWRFQMYLVYCIVAVMGIFVAVLASAGFGLTAMCGSEKLGSFNAFGNCLAGVTAWPIMLVVDWILVSQLDVSDKNDLLGGPSRAQSIGTIIVLGISAMFLIAFVIYYLVSLRHNAIVSVALDKLAAKASSKLKSDPAMYWETIRSSMFLAVAVFMVMIVTFLVLPSQMVVWTPSLKLFKDSKVYPDMVIFLFNVFDTVGRFMAMKNLIVLTPTQVFIGSFARIILVPMFFLASANRWIFAHDIFRLFLQAAFACTYGLLLNWGWTHGPNQPGIKKENSDTAGYVMSFAAPFGILIGSLISRAISGFPDEYLDYRPHLKPCKYEDYTMYCVQDEVLNIPQLLN